MIWDLAASLSLRRVHGDHLLVLRSSTLRVEIDVSIEKLPECIGRLVLIHLDLIRRCGSEGFVLPTAE